MCKIRQLKPTVDRNNIYGVVSHSQTSQNMKRRPRRFISKILQEMIEARLEKRKRTLLGPPIGKTMIYFVDDVNMPKLDTYGSQPPIELLRY